MIVSPLEAEIEKRNMDEVIHTVIAIGAHCSPLDLGIVRRYDDELNLMVITIGVHGI